MYIFFFNNILNLSFDFIFSQSDKIIDDQSNEYSSVSKDGFADKIVNGSKSILDKVLSPSKEKLSFTKVCIELLCCLYSYLLLI